MNIPFLIVAAIAVTATVLVVTHRNLVHALLLFIVSLLAVAVLFFMLGAPFVAGLEVIIYAGAIMVLFLFVVMMLNLGRESVEQEQRWMAAKTLVMPAVLSGALVVTLAWIIVQDLSRALSPRTVPPAEVGAALFGPYIWAVHIAALLLLAGLIGASHLRRHKTVDPRRERRTG